MWDYWLDEPHARRGAAYESPLHGIYAAYMAGPNGSAAPAGTSRALARLLELRMSLDLALDDAAGLLARSSGEGHHLARSSMQYMALEFHKFNRIHDYLMDRLDAARRASISHLIPISRQARALSAGMPDLRGDIVHPGSGLFGAVALPGPNGGAPGPAPGGSYLTCASLVNTFIDGLMHAIPQEFCSSLSGISPDVPEPCDFARLDASVSAHIAQNPVRCIALGRMGDAAIPVASELVRLRWALHGAAAAYGFTSELRAVPHAMPWPWDALQLQRLALYTRHMVIELHILVELCDRMRNAGLDAPGHSTVSEICEDREEVARLRALAVGWDADGEYAALSSEVGRGIGQERLLFLASVAAEWARVNAGHYMSRCAGGAQVPDLPDLARRPGLAAAQREAAPHRVRAHGELARRRVAPMVA